MKILAIITARHGSKGLPGKNESFLCGKSLFEWIFETTLDIPEISKRICSTDSSKVAEIASSAGWEIPFKRPKKLADDTTKVSTVVQHALNFYIKKNVRFSHVLLLQPTSPTVMRHDLDQAIELAKENNFDTVISVYEWDTPHPSTMFVGDNITENSVSWLAPKKMRELRRQDFPRVFVRTGLLYLSKTEVLLNDTLYGQKIGKVEIEKSRAICIDNRDDLIEAEACLNKRILYDENETTARLTSKSDFL